MPMRRPNKDTGVFIDQQTPITLRILVVEDSETDRALLTRMLKRFNTFITMNVLTAETLEDGINLLHECDAIVLDLNLPDSNGVQTAAEMREKTDKPIIVYSGDLSTERVLACGLVGVDAYFEKNFCSGCALADQKAIPSALVCFVGKTATRIRTKERLLAALSQ